MKRIISFITLIAIIVLVGCKPNEPEVFNVKDTSFMFDGKAGTSVPENGGTYKIPVILAGVPGSGSVSVKIYVDQQNSTAVEGVDFTVLTKSLTFSNGYGVDTVRISIIDNDEFTGDKKFVIGLEKPENAKLGTKHTATISIVDNEHPLGSVLGTYMQTDYLLTDNSPDGAPARVTIAAISGNTTQVRINNFWNGEKDIIANVNLENNTISILPGQTIFVSTTYGDCKAVAIDLNTKELVFKDPIVGEITETGIKFGAWAASVSAGYFGRYTSSTLVKQ